MPNSFLQPGLRRGAALALVCLLAASVAPFSASRADPAATQAATPVEDLRKLIEAQKAMLKEQQRQLEEQQDRIRSLEAAVYGSSRTGRVASGPVGPAGLDVRASGVGTGQPVGPRPRFIGGLAQAGQTGQTGQSGQADQTGSDQAAPASGSDVQPVGEAPTETTTQLAISGVDEVRGVLTPVGTVVIEPSIEYENSSSNRFFFNGVEIIETVLVGDIEITSADRDTITGRVSARTGLSDRMEMEVVIPYTMRADDIETQVISTGGGDTVNNLDASDFGDIELTGRYQINAGADGWPVFIGNLRVKTDSGKGPFDVSRNTSGEETELSTGSGFWGVQPGVTFIFPSDPVVFYGGLSYLWNIPRNVNETIGMNRFGKVDPGDVLSISFGTGVSLNERASLSIGYSHDFVFETVQKVNGIKLKSDTADVGTLSLGGSYRVNDYMSVNLSVGAGLTEDASDVRMMLRVPITLQLFE